MSEYTDFAAMTPPGASAYLARFLQETAAVLDQFASSIEVQLTYDPESLQPMWLAIEPMLAWRSGYVPPPAGHSGRRIRRAELEPPELLPSWFHHPSGAGYARFSARTLRLIDGAGRYLGEMLVRNNGGRWASGHSLVDGYMLQNQPVVEGASADPVCPFQGCAVLFSRTLKSARTAGPATLLDLYARWSEAVA